MDRSKHLRWVLNNGKDWSCREHEDEGAPSKGDNVNTDVKSGNLGEHLGNHVSLKKGK